MARLTIPELHAKLRAITSAVQKLADSPGVSFAKSELFDKDSKWQAPFLDKLIVKNMVVRTGTKWFTKYTPMNTAELKKLAKDQVLLAKLVSINTDVLELPNIEAEPEAETIDEVRDKVSTGVNYLSTLAETLKQEKEEPEPTASEQMQFVSMQNIVYMREKVDLIEKKLNKLLVALGEKP